MMDGPTALKQLGGGDPQMQRNVRSAQRIADSMVAILIQGPTGSGKEVFARAVHAASRRAARPFVALNCAAIPESLIESELFGYAAGAFTGARREGRRGKVQQADGGTLFLDEIGDMPLPLQTRLLRVLEDGHEVVPLGGETALSVDVRIISASHRDLPERIAEGRFREDLYYRLNGFTVELPPLAEREDRGRIIMDLLSKEAGGEPVRLDAAAWKCLMSHAWPGNIRELRNVLRTALAFSEGGVIRRYDLPRRLWPTARCPTTERRLRDAGSTDRALAAAEREALLNAATAHRWNMDLTARQLGVSRSTLYRKLKRHGIAVGSEFRRAVG